MDQHDDRADDAVQQQLPFDEPVPFRLTAVGRRLVASDQQPSLRVVDRGPGGGQGPPGRAVVLEELDAADRARARAMRRGGMHTLDIADRLGVEPIHVEQWVRDLPVPSGARRRRLVAVPTGRAALDADGGPATDATSGAARAGVVAAWRAARDDGRVEAERRLAADPTLRAGLGLVAGAVEQDHHALLLVGDDLDLLAAAWSWLLDTLAVDDRAARVLVRHDPTSAADRVAASVAAALGVDQARLTTTRDPSRTGATPAMRLRVADPVLAGRVAGWRRALLVAVSPRPCGRSGVGA